MLPIIILCTKKENGYLAGVGISFFYSFCSIFVANGNLVSFYPITAGLGIIKYENSVSGQIPYNQQECRFYIERYKKCIAVFSPKVSGWFHRTMVGK